MHSFLAKGRLLYTHDETIADLCARMSEIGERDTDGPAPPRGDSRPRANLQSPQMVSSPAATSNYTALWLLTAAMPLAQIEIIGRKLLADREVLPQAIELNPAFLQDRLRRPAQHQENPQKRPGRTRCRRRYLAERAPTLFAPVIDHLREVGEVRSCTEIEDHFKRNFDVGGVTPGVRIPGRPATDRQGLFPVQLTKTKRHRGAGAGVLLPRGSTGCLLGQPRGKPFSHESRGAHDHRRPGRARAQPQEHLGRDPARQARRRHRAFGLGQVEPRFRHDLRRGPAPLHGVALQLRQAVRRPGRQARRRLRLRPLAGDLDRAEDARSATRARPSAP